MWGADVPTLLSLGSALGSALGHRSASLAEFPQHFPGVDPGGVAISPSDGHRVLAHHLEGKDLETGGIVDGGGRRAPNGPGHIRLPRAMRTLAVAAESFEVDHGLPAIRPLEGQKLAHHLHAFRSHRLLPSPPGHRPRGADGLFLAEKKRHSAEPTPSPGASSPPRCP